MFGIGPTELLILVAFILPLVFGYFCSKILKNKGRSSGLGWLLGIFLGIIGLIIANILSPSSESLIQEQLRNGLSKKCIACKEVINIEATVCPYCQTHQL